MSEDKITIPEGEPNNEWSVEQLIAYGKEQFPDLKLMSTWKPETILGKLEEAAKGETPDKKSTPNNEQEEYDLKKVYKSYFDANKGVDTLYFTSEKNGKTMGFLKERDAKKRQVQVDPKSKVKTVNRKYAE